IWWQGQAHSTCIASIIVRAVTSWIYFACCQHWCYTTPWYLNGILSFQTCESQGDVSWTGSIRYCNGYLRCLAWRKLSARWTKGNIISLAAGCIPVYGVRVILVTAYCGKTTPTLASTIGTVA